MLVDFRCYKVRPGKLTAHLDIYEKHGFAAQARHCGKPIAYLYPEAGELNTLYHLWAFESAADREQKRAALANDPEWINYVKLNAEAGYLVETRNQFLLPTKFSTIVR